MISDRLATAPISWGICEVPGWGTQLDRARVLREMQAAGFRATELGEPTYFPDDPDETRALLASHGLRLIAGFVPLVLHDPDQLETSLTAARTAADRLKRSGAELFNTAAVTSVDWGPRHELSPAAWDQLVTGLARVEEVTSSHGLTQVLHPHVDTVVETDAELRRVLDSSPVAICFDTGHAAVGGTDPVDFARRHAERIGLVHIKDVNMGVAHRLNTDELTLVDAVQQGLFPPLGRGDIDLPEVIAALESSGYDGWYVLEQDTALTAGEPPEGAGPILDVLANVEYMRAVEAKRLVTDTSSGARQ